MNTSPDGPSVLTSEVYNEAEVIFTTLQNKEKLVSFLDCTTILRGMGMNPTYEDMEKLRDRMAEPIVRLEQWRRAEELKREKERRKEEKRERKGKVRRTTTTLEKKKSTMQKVLETTEKPTKIIPIEEVKNIDWNIFITCAEEMFRDASTEQKTTLKALQVVTEEDRPDAMTRTRLAEVLTSTGESVLAPAEVKQLKPGVPVECPLVELAGRIQGTYVPPTQEELDRLAAQAMEERRKREEAEKAASEDPLAGL